MALYLVTFDIHGAQSPPGNLYSDIYRGFRTQFGEEDVCKDFGQFCLVRSDEPVQAIKEQAKAIIDRQGNLFAARDIVVFSVGDEISISRGRHDNELREFRRFFVAAR